MFGFITDAWTWNRNTPQHNQRIPFTGAPGLKVRVPADASLLDYYKLFVQDDLMEMIVQETNRYGAQLPH